MIKKLFLISSMLITGLITHAQDQPKENTTDSENTYAQENLKNDMAVVFAQKSTDRLDSEIPFIEWGKALNEFLLATDDDFTQAMTLAKMISGIKSAATMAKMHKNDEQINTLNDLSYQPIADVVNQMIGQPEISPEAFDILTSICAYDEMQNHCNLIALLQKRMHQDYKNLQAFIRAFDMAIQANDRRSTEQILQLMAASQYSHTPRGVTPTMNHYIDEFIANNPIPESAIENMVADYQKLSGISPDKKAQLDELMPDYMPVFIKFSYGYLNDVPPYRMLKDYCQTHVKAATYCRDIAKILINKSNATIDKGIGHAILIASYEVENNEAGVAAASQLNDSFRSSYECIGKLVSGRYFIDQYFDPEYQAISLNVKDEYEMAIQLAELRYRKLTAAGDQNAVDPATCFEKE